MSLRDENPLIDNDLSLIIEAYEKAMLKSRDADSVFVPFRRHLEKMTNLPQSIITSIDAVPLPAQDSERDRLTPDNQHTDPRNPRNTVEEDIQDTRVADFPAEAPSRVPTPEEEIGNPASGKISEDGDDEEDWQEKVSNWVSECVPCDFRVMSSLDADFFADISTNWENALDKTWDNLKKLDGLLSDENVVNPFCELADALKMNCPGDLEKMMFLLSTLLDQMELQVGLDLGIADDYLSSILEPIFSELGGMLDLIDDSVLKPVRCVLDVIEYNINRGPAVARRMQDAYSVSRRTGWGDVTDTADGADSQSESQELAGRAREEVQAQQSSNETQANPNNALDRVESAFERAEHTLSFLDRFKNLVEEGKDYLEEKKDWLLSLIEEFLDNGFERWNDTVSFARGKNDILTYISILKAFVDAAKSDDFECGPDSGIVDRSNVITVMEYFQHPAEALDVTVEDGIIVARRNPPSSESASGSDPDADIRVTSNIDNIVARRPISSCLNKVTSDEAEQVNHWIRQLEQDS